MLLTPEHRRSNRRRVSQKTFDVKSFIENNKVETMPGKLYRLETKNVEVEKKNVEVKEEENYVEKHDDIYDECPEHAGYEYDKDMYLANDRYAEMVDNDIKDLKNGSA